MGGESFAFRARLVSADRQLLLLPLFHVNAEIYSIMGALVAGSTLVLIDSFHASTFWSTVHDQHITQFNFLGVIANILLKAEPSSFDHSQHVRLACGAGLSAETITAFRARFHIPLLETYGLTEAPMGLSNTLSDTKEGSIGKASRHPHPDIFTEVKLVDHEIVLRTPALALGYWHNPAETKQVFRDGWFYTGDLGRLDEDGYYYFVDRQKDIIRKKGENISSREIELIIGQLSGVVEVAVIPIPSPLGEDDIKAYIVQQSSATLTSTAVRLHCQKHLSLHKTPALVEFVDSLPKTPTNKIAKNELKKTFHIIQSRRITPRALLIDGVRTPFAKIGSDYQNQRPDTLLATTLTALGERTHLTSSDDLIVGCVNQLGEGERNMARQALLLSNLSPTTPASTVTRLSGSSLEAARLAFASLASGLRIFHPYPSR
jgi:acyl-CoA synthetase (AMP-forming)/AMP-acid ligase II